MIDRFPTATELDEGVALEEAENFQKYLRAKAGKPVTTILTEVEADQLADLEANLPAPKPHISCPQCGKIFVYKTEGMAKMQRTRHMRKDHPDGA